MVHLRPLSLASGRLAGRFIFVLYGFVIGGHQIESLGKGLLPQCNQAHMAIKDEVLSILLIACGIESLYKQFIVDQ